MNDVRVAKAEDARTVGRLLHEFNVEFGDRRCGRTRSSATWRSSTWLPSGAGVRSSEDDVAARALYESLGFSNRDDGAVMYFYDRPL